MPGYISHPGDILRTTSNVETPGVNVSSENTSQKIFIGNDTISEIVNDSDSVVILVNFLTVTPAKYIHPTTAAAAAVAAVAARKSKLPSQDLTETGRKHAGPFLNGQTKILS
jgi:hypothetical protein